MDENERKIALIKKKIHLTEQRLQNYFNDSMHSLTQNRSPEKTTQVPSKRCFSSNNAKIINKTNTKEQEKRESLNKTNKKEKIQKNNSQRSCLKCKPIKNKSKNNPSASYDKIMRTMQLKKVRILDELQKMEDKKLTNRQEEKKFKYQISVLKAEILNEQENKKKLSSNLEKYQNRYKLNNFHPENHKNIPKN